MLVRVDLLESEFRYTNYGISKDFIENQNTYIIKHIKALQFMDFDMPKPGTRQAATRGPWEIR
jgi:hypothetical protein